MKCLASKLTVRCAAFSVMLLILSNTTSSLVLADVFRIDLPQLERGYPYGYSPAAVPINLGTPLANLVSIQLELSGTHTNGWWETSFGTSGPEAGLLAASMDSASPSSLQWKGTYDGAADGPFTATMTLQGAGSPPDWSFLQDGITDLTLAQGQTILPPFSQLVTAPYFALTAVTLVVNATPAPVPEPSALVLIGIVAIGLAAYAWRRRD